MSRPVPLPGHCAAMGRFLTRPSYLHPISSPAETNQQTVREMCERTKLDFAPWLTNIFDDSEYPKILQENESRLKGIAEALMHHQSVEAERMTPPNIFINWNLTEKDRLNVNTA